MSEHEQLSFSTESETSDETVVCLGLTFKNDDERREYFREELRKKLPELKQIDGFPIGKDEDIIALSDPPYYTACPNPWVNSFIEEWKKEKVTKFGHKSDEEYHREPFATDISEGKNDPIYNAHSYHTKVPYKAIMRYLMYYTNPGDIIYDGFCGSGMTGVAAQMCADINSVNELGYEWKDKDTIIINEDNLNLNSKIGPRKALLYDLAPAATFISHNYNKKAKAQLNTKKLADKISHLRKEYIWLFSTLHDTSDILIDKISDLQALRDFYEQNQSKFAEINYVVWSEVYDCNSCNNEFSYWDSAYEDDKKTIRKKIICPLCHAEELKKNVQKVYINSTDPITKEIINQPKLIPVRINYSYNKKRFDKQPDVLDLKLIYLLNDIDLTHVPNEALPPGIKTSEPIRQGLSHVHHFYTNRILFAINAYFNNFKEIPLQDKQFLLGSVLPKLTKMNRFMPQHGSRALVGPMANALYFPPLSVENNFISQIEFQFKKITKAWNDYEGNVISTQSSTKNSIPDNSIDYIFIDPPFGANIMYSELSFAREAWLNIRTNNDKEAIENKAHNKSINDYTRLITDSFKEAHRILKPNRWITVEFSNTQSSIWNAIQYALQEAGFIIASVDALNKKRGGLHAMLTNTAVKQDLVISAYKPSTNILDKMREQSNTNASAWTFITQHLEKLPIFISSKGTASIINERTPRILFDRMVAYHVLNGLSVPISSADFQSGIAQRYPNRDGMIFLESQVAEYDKKRILAKDFYQVSLFVSDENSAIEWIRQQLLKTPQTRQDLHPKFMKEIQHIAKHEKLPELDDLLSQNFLRYDSEPEVPSQIVSYFRRNYPDLRGLESTDRKIMQKAMNRWYVPDPNKQADLEKLREKSLLREFNLYVDEMAKSKKKLKEFRTEAIRAGFKKAWSEKDYQTIVDVGNRLPETVIQEDDKLLMYFDNAQIKLGL